jgi:uncharacterized protein (TIGR03382 family)
LNATGFVIATAVLGLAALGVSIVRRRREA